MPKVGPEMALEKVHGYLGELEKLKKLGYIDGEPQRENLNYKIKAFINNAFDNPEVKIKEYDNYVNFFFVVAGEKKTSQQKNKEYQRNLREMKTMLESYGEELEMLRYNADQIPYNSKQVFIVHGHDSSAKNELARIIDREFKLESIVLHEQPDKGRTIIEKLEHVSKLPGYAFVLLTPDDLGGIRIPNENIEYFNSPDMKVTDQKTQFKYRARQNVILELGYFLGLLGRDRVCCLYKEAVELPSDISGILYKRFVENVSE
ncbi:hypothetical protein BH18THE2_BH18THE2_11600 [soil metagenome]